jgi:hypothetical protein
MKPKSIWKFTTKDFLLAFVIVMCTIVATYMLLIDPYTKQNTSIISGNYKSIEVIKNQRAGISYDLYLEKDQKDYQIHIGYTACFDYDSFIKEVAVGQMVSASVAKHYDILTFSKTHLAVAIDANGKQYLRMNCANNDLKQVKRIVPLLFIPILFIIGFLIYRFLYVRIKKGT